MTHLLTVLTIAMLLGGVGVFASDDALPRRSEHPAPPPGASATPESALKPICISGLTPNPGFWPSRIPTPRVACKPVVLPAGVPMPAPKCPPVPLATECVPLPPPLGLGVLDK